MGGEEVNNFLAADGEMGALTRAFDWSKTPLGSPETWPQSLRVTVRLVLTSRHPMFIWWGPELIQFYNDAYRETMGPERHPSALGARGRDCWAEIWDNRSRHLRQPLSNLMDYPAEVADEDAQSLALAIRQCLSMLTTNQSLSRGQFASLLCLNANTDRERVSVGALLEEPFRIAKFCRKGGFRMNLKRSRAGAPENRELTETPDEIS